MYKDTSAIIDFQKSIIADANLSYKLGGRPDFRSEATKKGRAKPAPFFGTDLVPAACVRWIVGIAVSRRADQIGQPGEQAAEPEVIDVLAVVGFLLEPFDIGNQGFV